MNYNAGLSSHRSFSLYSILILCWLRVETSYNNFASRIHTVLLSPPSWRHIVGALAHTQNPTDWKLKHFVTYRVYLWISIFFSCCWTKREEQIHKTSVQCLVFDFNMERGSQNDNDAIQHEIRNTEYNNINNSPLNLFRAKNAAQKRSARIFKVSFYGSPYKHFNREVNMNEDNTRRDKRKRVLNL